MEEDAEKLVQKFVATNEQARRTEELLDRMEHERYVCVCVLVCVHVRARVCVSRHVCVCVCI